MRLEFQKQITADVAAQAAAPAQASYSRTYASMRDGHATVPASRRESVSEDVEAAVDAVFEAGRGGAAGLALPTSHTDAHLSAASRHVPPSTEALLARMIDAAFDVAGVPLPAALAAPQQSLGAAPSRDPLQQAVHDLRLDAPYRHVAARWLGRNLASSDSAYQAEAASGDLAARFPGTAALGSGATTAACLTAWEAVQGSRRAGGGGAGAGSGNSNGAAGALAAGAPAAPPGGEEADDLLDGALDELLA